METQLEKRLNQHHRRRHRLAPARLGEKLKRIRTDYGLSQGTMLLVVNPTELTELNRARISQYEKGIRVPSPIELYNYARFSARDNGHST